jgi:hypothetical protein
VGRSGHFEAIFHGKWDVSALEPGRISPEWKGFYGSRVNLTMPYQCLGIVVASSRTRSLHFPAKRYRYAEYSSGPPTYMHWQ